MNRYTVTFYDRNAIDPRDNNEIQRSIIRAEDEQEARDIFMLANCEVISVELYADIARARSIALDESGNLRPYFNYTRRRGALADNHEIHSYTWDGE